MVLQVFPKSTVQFQQSLEKNALSRTSTIKPHLPPSSPMELFCSKIGEVADSLTFRRGPRLTSRPSVGSNRQYAGKAANPRIALKTKAIRKSDIAYRPWPALKKAARCTATSPKN